MIITIYRTDRGGGDGPESEHAQAPDEYRVALDEETGKVHVLELATGWDAPEWRPISEGCYPELAEELLAEALEALVWRIRQCGLPVLAARPDVYDDCPVKLEGES